MSMRPNAASVSWTQERTSDDFVTSHTIPFARPPFSSMALTRSARSLAVRATPTTTAPSFASASALARPMPRLAPVMTETLFARRMAFLRCENRRKQTSASRTRAGRSVAGARLVQPLVDANPELVAFFHELPFDLVDADGGPQTA